MDINNVVSAPASGDLTGKEYQAVKMTSTGIAIATSTDYAIVVGTLIRAMPHQEDGVYLGKSVAIQRRHAGIHFATIGASSAAVAQGATLVLDSANPGYLVPGSSNVVAVAWDAFTAASGAIVRVAYL